MKDLTITHDGHIFWVWQNPHNGDGLSIHRIRPNGRLHYIGTIDVSGAVNVPGRYWAAIEANAGLITKYMEQLFGHMPGLLVRHNLQRK